MSIYQTRTCVMCGRAFKDDCNDYFCSDKCEEHALEVQEREGELAAERARADAALDASRPR